MRLGIGYGILTVGLMLGIASACVKVDPGAAAPGLSTCAVTFQTPIINAATKADPSKVEYPQESSFGVYGLYYRSGNFSGWESTPGAVMYIDGAEFRHSQASGTSEQGVWTSDPIYYWPKGGKMTFGAWSPYSLKEEYAEGFSYGKSGLAISGFSSGTDGATDLMYADRVYDQTHSGADGIDLVFHHSLAALKFKKAGSDDKVTIKITKVIVWGIIKKGNPPPPPPPPATSPSSYASKPQWELSTAEYYTEEAPLTIGGSESPEAYIIPQDISDSAKMKVYYSVQVGTGNPVQAVSDPINMAGKKTSDGTQTIANWNMSTRYIYNLTFTSLHPIRFSIDVNDWGGQLTDISD